MSIAIVNRGSFSSLNAEKFVSYSSSGLASIAGNTNTKTIAETAKIINADDTVHNTMLTIRDGLMLCIKK